MEKYIPIARTRYISISEKDHKLLKPLVEKLIKESNSIEEGDIQYLTYSSSYKVKFLTKLSNGNVISHPNIIHHYESGIYEFVGYPLKEASLDQRKSLELQYMFCLSQIPIKPNLDRVFFKEMPFGYLLYEVDNKKYYVWNEGVIAKIIPIDDKVSIPNISYSYTLYDKPVEVVKSECGDRCSDKKLRIVKNKGIVDYRWGSVNLTDKRSFKDVIIDDNQIVEWDWKQYGLRHLPGYTKDVVDIIVSEFPNRKIIASTGLVSQINTPYKHKDIIFLQSDEAMKLYLETENSVLFFHSTC